MEEKLATIDVADVTLIADVSANTAAAFTQYGRIFLWWGIIALVECVPLSFYSYTRQMDNNLNRQNNQMILSHIQNNQFATLLIIIGFAVMIAGWYLVYHFLARSVNPSGMSKELMKLWVWSVVVTLIPIIPTIISVSYGYAIRALFNLPLEPDLYLISIFILRQFLWFIFSLSMMVTGTLTRTKTYIWFALLLALIGVIVQSGVFAYPVTFLLLGGYLEWKRRENTIQGQGSIL